jgi:hypothetical protein
MHACAAKDVSGGRGTDVCVLSFSAFVTAGRIVDMQSLKIGWLVGAVAAAVRSRDRVSAAMELRRTLYLYHLDHLHVVVVVCVRACNNTIRKHMHAGKRAPSPFSFGFASH